MSLTFFGHQGFFHPRKLEVILMRGSERLTSGKAAAIHEQAENELYRTNTASSSSSSSSSESSLSASAVSSSPQPTGDTTAEKTNTLSEKRREYIQQKRELKKRYRAEKRELRQQRREEKRERRTERKAERSARRGKCREERRDKTFRLVVVSL